MAVEPKIYQTRWSVLKELWSPVFMLLVAVYSVTSGILVHSYMNLALPTFGSLSIQCLDRWTHASQFQNYFWIFIYHLEVLIMFFRELTWRDTRKNGATVVHLNINQAVKYGLFNQIKNELISRI